MPPAFRVLHALHDYLPRHQAGSEIYVAGLCAALTRAGQHPVVLAAEYAPHRPHGQITWRSHAGTPVAEVANSWQFATFADTYGSPALTATLGHVLDVVQPHVLHVHNLLNLSMDLPALARARGIAVVATLHDYTLVCPSGGQRLHRAEAHVCRAIEPGRCARCFPDSPLHAQWRIGQVAGRAPARLVAPLGAVARRLAPRLTEAAGAAMSLAPAPPLAAADISRRLESARRAWAACSLIVAPSASLAREYEGLGFPADRLIVSDYGFEALAPRPREPAGDGRLRVGFLGSLVWHKGADLLIEAARALPAERVEIRIFGDPRVSPGCARALEASARDLPVRFMGRFDHDEVAGVMAGIDVLVVPSRWLENSPLVIHEAFMAGVPVIGTAIGGTEDLLTQGGGLLVPPDDAGALAAAIRSLVEVPGRIDALRGRIPEVKSLEVDAREWIDRYAGACRTAAAAVMAS
jgi:glycosyltransferase involved in cell wall biosynthesis